MAAMATLAPAPRLRGREPELQALGDAFDRVAAGHLTIVLVEGEAGIGKTRLLAEALDDARARGLQVVTGRAQELERTRPFGVLADAFACDGSSPDPRRRAIAALLATRLGDREALTVSSDPGLQFQAVDAFLELLESLALDGPLVVGLDDLQWADPSSLLTLGTLAGRLADVPLALVGCLRLLPRPPELTRALGAVEAAGGRRLPLGPLGEDAVAELVAEVVAAEPGRRLLAEVAGAGGNALFATELVGALLQEGAIRVADGRAELAEVAEAPLPATLRLTILRRLGLLPDHTLEALRAASILGSSLSLTDLSTTTGRSALELSSALAEAIRARVLEDDGDGLRFRHDLLREALYEDLPAGVRVALHREAGRRLAAGGAPALRVAEHLVRGAAAGDGEAVAWLARAAREAAPRSPATAADLLERALALADPADPDRDRLLAERADALMWSGRLPDAEAACRSLLERGPGPSPAATGRLLLARTLATQGRMRESLQELERLRQAPALGDELRAGAGAAEAMARLQLGDLEGAATAAAQAHAAALPGDHPAVILALTALAIVEELRADLPRALQTADEAVRLADRSPRRRGHQEVVHLTRGNILMELDRLQDARSTLQTGRRIGEELGVRWRLPLYQAVLGTERFLAGEWDDAVAELEAAVALAEETGERHSLVLTSSVRSLIALHRGELRQAEAAAAGAEAELADSGHRFRSHWATWARALLQEAEGASRDALATLDGAWELCARAGFAIEYPVLGPDLVRLTLAAGEQGRAAQVAAAVAEVAAGNPVPWLGGAALRC
jgi:tetratricopeptide (TPR) repeat protein